MASKIPITDNHFHPRPSESNYNYRYLYSQNVIFGYYLIQEIAGLYMLLKLFGWVHNTCRYCTLHSKGISLQDLCTVYIFYFYPQLLYKCNRLLLTIVSWLNLFKLLSAVFYWL